MLVTLRERSWQSDFVESQLEDGKPIEVCFSGIWYPATVVRILGHKIEYRLEAEVNRVVGQKMTLLGRRPDVVVYPVGYTGILIVRMDVNVRLRSTQ